MEKKYTAITIILLIIQFIRLIVNINLLIFIYLFDAFLLIDIVTVVAIVLLIFSIIGIFLKKKWGPILGISNAVFDIIINIIVSPIGIIFAFILNLVVIILASIEYFHINTYNNPTIKQPTGKYQPLPIQPSQIVRHCTNCGVVLKGTFCHECGKKVDL